MIRWVVNDEEESSIYKRKRDALAEYKRLHRGNYLYKNTLEILRHDTKTDIYTEVLIRAW